MVWWTIWLGRKTLGERADGVHPTAADVEALAGNGCAADTVVPVAFQRVGTTPRPGPETTVVCLSLVA